MLAKVIIVKQFLVAVVIGQVVLITVVSVVILVVLVTAVVDVTAVIIVVLVTIVTSKNTYVPSFQPFPNPPRDCSVSS
jgi:hypothetical protein